MTALPPAVLELAAELQALGWVTDLYVGGSLATGDYVPGVSDIDLVALVDGPVKDPDGGSERGPTFGPFSRLNCNPERVTPPGHRGSGGRG